MVLRVPTGALHVAQLSANASAVYPVGLLRRRPSPQHWHANPLRSVSSPSVLFAAKGSRAQRAARRCQASTGQEPVYQGRYSSWSLDERDKLEVLFWLFLFLTIIIIFELFFYLHFCYLLAGLSDVP